MHGSGFWGRLGDREREALAAAARSRIFPGGTVLCMQGEPSTDVFILLSGWVKVISVTRDGREILLALLGEGDIVGEIAGYVTGYRTATVQAISTVRSLIAGAGQFEAFLDSHPEAARAHRRIMAEHLRAAHQSQRGKIFTSGPERLASLLLDLAGQHGEMTARGLTTSLPLTQEELASLIGVSRSTVTRALSQWRARHIILTRQRNITILDEPMMQRIAGRKQDQ